MNIPRSNRIRKGITCFIRVKVTRESRDEYSDWEVNPVTRFGQETPGYIYARENEMLTEEEVKRIVK